MSKAPSSWGNTVSTTSTLIPFSWRNQPLPESQTSMLPHGLGRSYGDSCLNDGGTLLTTPSLDRIISFDAEQGILECESGMSLEDILRFASPRGWFLPVTPGSRVVTVGGAIANDVHGKNHHRAGTFATCVRSFDLLRSDGSRRTCSRTQHARWFRATVGGLGLTGLITSATLQLRKTVSPLIDVEQLRMRNLEDFFLFSDESEATHEYTVAWIDGLATGEDVGKGIFIRGNHSHRPSDLQWAEPRQLPMPVTAPGGLLNTATVKAFNSLYSNKFRGEQSSGTEHFLKFFYPLDGVDNWNRMYGKRGFFQHQCVVPRETGGGVIREILNTIGESGQASFLAVLKIFGDAPKEGLLSFPRPGVTLAMDLPNRGQKTLDLMDQLDRRVLNHGGAVYPAKDARMSPEMFRNSFPALDTFTPYIDPRFSSSFWRRVMEIS